MHDPCEKSNPGGAKDTASQMWRNDERARSVKGTKPPPVRQATKKPLSDAIFSIPDE